MRVLICDDHVIFAESVGHLLRSRGVDVARVTYHPNEAVAVLRRTPVDLCLLDLMFGGETVLDRLNDLRAAAPRARFVVLCASPDAALYAAGRTGRVHGIGDKRQSIDEILRLLTRVHAGEPAGTASAGTTPAGTRSVSVAAAPGLPPAPGSGTAPRSGPARVPGVPPGSGPPAAYPPGGPPAAYPPGGHEPGPGTAPGSGPVPAQRTAARPGAAPAAVTASDAGKGHGVRWLAAFLTPREREVLSALVRGEDTLKLANSLGIAQATARCHIQAVLTKLGAHSRLEAATTAVRAGMVDPQTGRWLRPPGNAVPAVGD